jgi:hypothetical protein
MNQSFYESRSKEKINDLMKEGMTSQAYYRSRASKAGFLSRLPKLILVILGIVGLIQMFVR